MKIGSILAGVLVVAAVSTAGDLVWLGLHVEHRVVWGVLHGVALLAAVGSVLGVAAGRLTRGVPLGMVAGVAGAATYYLLAPLIRGGALIAAWTMLWAVLAVLDGRFLRSSKRSAQEILLRCALAAIGSGATFYLVVGTLWGRTPVTPGDFLIQLAGWFVAWAPGLLALTLDARRP